jgi:23S rRNA pseudouridine2604 synthase
LDKDSQGLIFLTSNGDLVNKVLRAGNNHEKDYVVTVNKPITDSFIEGLAGGVPILGRMTKKCPVTKVSPNVFNITLVQGLNRQIRRMCEHFGYEVVKLERTRIMNVSLKGLPVGDWRDLTPKEMAVLLKSIEDSSSEDSTAAKKSRKAPRKKPRTDTSSKSKESSKPTGAAKGNAKHPKDGTRKPAGSKGKDRRPFGDSKKPAGKGKPAASGKRPAKGRGSSRSSKR